MLSFKCLLNTILSEQNMAKYFLLQLSSSLKFLLKVGRCMLILCMQKIVESQRLVYFWLDSTAILNFLFSQHIQWKSSKALLELNKDKEKKLDKKVVLSKCSVMFIYRSQCMYVVGWIHIQSKGTVRLIWQSNY